jgi:hypothetical protein
MVSYKDNCQVPAICAECRSFTVLNYLTRNRLLARLRREHRCRRCGGEYRFYNDSALQERGSGIEASNEVFSWRVGASAEVFMLRNTGYLCPSCGQLTMRFRASGYWD